MVFLNINTKNYEEKDSNGKTQVDVLNEIIKGNSNNKIFILYYMEGCGPCNATRPEWSKLQNTLKKYENSKNLAIVDIDHLLSSKIKNSGKEPSGFPTIRFITKNGETVEDYNNDRTIDSFTEWVNSKTEGMQGGKKNKKTKSNKKTIKNKKTKGGKWSLKYKRSINCRRPKGFSQRQHCKYGRKNINN
jgi:hypothetical protein